MTVEAGSIVVARLVRAASFAFGLMWIVAAMSKVVEPLDAWEFTVRAVGYATWTPLAFGAVAAAEAGLGVAMILGGVRGFVPTIALLGVATVALMRVKSALGGRLPCGCFSVFAPSSIDGALGRNAVLIAVAFLCAMTVYVRRRSAARG